MKKIIIASILIALSFIAGYFLSVKLNKIPEENILLGFKKPDKTLERYTIENLTSTDIKTGSFNIGTEIIKKDEFTTYLFRFRFIPDVTGNIYKTTSGVINIPDNEEIKHPIVLLVRGYVDQNFYTSGMGSKNIGEYLAGEGFITVAPDFLGYGDSDSEATNIFESRFQTYVTVLSLLKTIEGSAINSWDGKNIFIWGHSNGGQIALTTLEVSGGNYPTVLWAPVSKPFPYSVLYYTDESEDHGKLIRSQLSKFESFYNVEKYSLTNYIDKINAPIQLHQGTADDAVPMSWSNLLSKNLKGSEKEVQYITHPGADHNMQPYWNNAAKQTLDFFVEKLK